MAYKKLPGIRAFYKNEPPALKQREEVKITPKDPLPMGLPYSESYLESRGISMEDYKKLIASRLDNQKKSAKRDTPKEKYRDTHINRKTGQKVYTDTNTITTNKSGTKKR